MRLEGKGLTVVTLEADEEPRSLLRNSRDSAIGAGRSCSQSRIEKRWHQARRIAVRFNGLDLFRSGVTTPDPTFNLSGKLPSSRQGDGWIQTTILLWRTETSACPSKSARVGLDSTPGDHLASCPNAFGTIAPAGRASDRSRPPRVG